MTARILAARHVLPISSDPIRDGAVVIENDAIAAVGPLDELTAKYPSAAIEDHGEAAILPGYVNCHSHLELTALRGSLDAFEHDFAAWLLTVTKLRADMSDEEVDASAVAGAEEGAAAGVTFFGDIGRRGSAGLNALKTVGLRGIVHQETDFTPDDRTADEDLKRLAEKFDALAAEQTDLVRVGLSPHSPYTVSSKLLGHIAGMAIIYRIPLTIHAAESANEQELLTRGEGLFTRFFEAAELDWNSPHSTSIEYLERLGVLSARPLLAHCVRASSTDIDRLASNGVPVAHCPRSNAKLGHGIAPLEAFLDRGLTVGLGSDSVASNNACDLLEEARIAALFARTREDRKRNISAKEVLRAATLGGAKALGLGEAIGSLEAGKQADIAVVGLSRVGQQPVTDVEAALVFSSNGADVLRTIVAGRDVYLRDGRPDA